MKKLILILFLGMFCISLTLAVEQSWGTVKGGDCIELTMPCDNCTYNNITSILYPNKTTYALRGEYSMDQSGTLYNYSFCDTLSLGKYVVSGHGDLDGDDTIWTAHFESTSTGKLPNNITPIFLLIFSFALLVIGIVIKSPPVGFFSGVLFIMAGMYLMIYGFGNVTDLYTRALALIVLCFGILATILAGLSWLDEY